MQETQPQRQLTFRAAVPGMLLGGFMSLSNLYVSLKTGWSMGVSMTAGIVNFLQWYLFDIKIWMGVLSVFISFFIAIVACRATGETDTTPTGALGTDHTDYLRRFGCGQRDDQPDDGQCHSRHRPAFSGSAHGF